MSVASLCDHRCRIWRRTETLGTRREVIVNYAVPAGYEALDCTLTRRKTVMRDSGGGLQPVGQRTVFLPDTSLTWSDRDIVEVYEGPSIFAGAMRLEAVSATVPRGNHVELIGHEWDGKLPGDGES